MQEGLAEVRTAAAGAVEPDVVEAAGPGLARAGGAADPDPTGGRAAGARLCAAASFVPQAVTARMRTSAAPLRDHLGRAP